MRALNSLPLDQWLAGWWRAVDRTHKLAFLGAACISLLAFGFEATNLTLHHDDLNHLMVQKPLVGYYLGRFVHAWLFFYGLQGQFAPFLHMTAGMLLMCLYGVLVAHFWGARRTLDVALVAAIACVFPYMAQVYQYNSVMVAYPLAHLLAATAVVLAVRARPLSTVLAALLFFLAFSIYQAVLANAATIFLVWVLSCAVFPPDSEPQPLRKTARAAVAALIAVAVGGVLHVLAVKSLNIPFDSSQGADQAFSLRSRLEHGLQFGYAAGEVLRGTRAFFVWPEPYLPQPLKLLQGLLLVGGGLVCLLLPRRLPMKAGALMLLVLAVFAPRVMQFMHPQGTFHHLTLTAYALVIAAAVMLLLRGAPMLARNAAIVVTILLLTGYVMQCNWISTVNYLNTQAHFATLNQIMARLRSAPEQNWDGRTVAVVGRYDMPSEFPFRQSTGVASEFMTARHMNFMARLLRDEARFVQADASLPKVLEFAAERQPWPSPQSVGIVDGVAVVVLSKPGKSRAADPGED